MIQHKEEGFLELEKQELLQGRQLRNVVEPWENETPRTVGVRQL